MAPEQTGTATTTEPETGDTVPAAAAADDAAPANISTVSVDSTNGEHDPYFEPVVSLPEVAIKTLEEDEEVLYKERCKLFRYATDTSEWKERGTGNVKLLKNERKGTVRLLMRQEKTLKVRANHYLTPYMKLRPSVGSDRAFVWYVMLDFADEEAKNEMFAIRFANTEIAGSFKEAFEEAVIFVTTTTAGLESSDEEEDALDEKEMERAAAAATPSTPATDDVTKDLEKLQVKDSASPPQVRKCEEGRADSSVAS